MTCWGPVGPDLNKAQVVNPSPPLARILELAGEFFGPESGGFGVVVEADAGHPVEAELRAAGWEVFEDEPALVLTPIPVAPPPPVGVEIRAVRDAEGRRDLLRVLAAGFGEPTAEGGTELSPEAFESFAPSVACALDPDVCLLVGYLDRVPASSAMLFKVGAVAGLTGVATVPAHRRRGLGMAATWAAIREGAARGCSYAALAALGASYDMYRKMGFVRVCNHRAYRPPATKRVTLRQVEEGDLPTFFEQQADPIAVRMANFPPRDREAFMAHWRKCMAHETTILRAILVGGRAVGHIVSWEQDGGRSVGYWIGREFWGKGIATEALRRLLEEVTTRPLTARVAKHNAASIRVLHKGGFTIAATNGEEVLLTLGAQCTSGIRA
jgi:RimJ/RimL family protein N-acetyltransferase